MTRCPASCWLVNVGTVSGRVLAVARWLGSPVTPAKPSPAMEARNPRRVGGPPSPAPPVRDWVMVDSLPSAAGVRPALAIHYGRRGAPWPEARVGRLESFRPGRDLRVGPHAARTRRHSGKR